MATTNISWAKQQFMLKHPEKYGGLAKVRAIIYGNKNNVNPAITGATVDPNQPMPYNNINPTVMPDTNVKDTTVSDNLQTPKKKRRVTNLYKNE